MLEREGITYIITPSKGVSTFKYIVEERTNAFPPEDLKQLEEIKARNELELQNLTEANDEEIAQLEECYIKQLKDAKAWLEQHAEQIYIEKQIEYLHWNKAMAQRRHS